MIHQVLEVEVQVQQVETILQIQDQMLVWLVVMVEQD